MKIEFIPKVLLYWYIFIFFSTEILSYLHILERGYVFWGEIFFWAILLFLNRKEFRHTLQNINFRSKSFLFVLFMFTLTFVQGFFSAPSTTDSMVYHLPRVMYWIQEKTLHQDSIRNIHDFMAPFAEYILLHLYFITGSDKILFFSQWISYVVMVILSFVIAEKLGADKKTKTIAALFIATLPIAVMQASSTQVDMIVAILIVISAYLALLLLEKVTIKNSILFALALGLGISTKATFYPYIIIPLGLILFLFTKKQWRKSLPIILAGLITLIMPVRFMTQNLSLYGNILGPIEEDGGLVLTNGSINLVTLISNLIRNIMLHLPVPFFTSQAQSFLEFIHKLIGISINAPETTCCDFQFHVAPILYPQEDIIVNPLSLLLILISIFLIFKKNVIKNQKLVLIFVLSLLSFVAFSAILKWQPFHSRLQIPFFVIGTITSVVILSKFNKGLPVLKIFLGLSILLAVLLVFLNVSRPFISYNLFYSHIKSFAFPLSSVPESFFIKPREEQYFNARYYWYEPYKKIISTLDSESGNVEISLDLMDDFEYPIWVFLKDENINFHIVSYSQAADNAVIISTSKEPTVKENFRKSCLKTQIDYGYICLSKKINFK